MISKDAYTKLRENESVYQITHIVCAKCGHDSTQRSNTISSNIACVELIGGLVQLNFTCPACGETYCLSLVDTLPEIQKA